MATKTAAKAATGITVRLQAEPGYRPKYAHSGDAGADLRACLNRDLRVPAHGSATVPTGARAAIPEGYAGLVFGRSGLGCKSGIRPANCVGVIDSGYRGEILVTLHNDSKYDFTVSDGDRIAQLVVVPVPSVRFSYVKSLDATERGEGGFGSTGVA